MFTISGLGLEMTLAKDERDTATVNDANQHMITPRLHLLGNQSEVAILRLDQDPVPDDRLHPMAETPRRSSFARC